MRIPANGFNIVLIIVNPYLPTSNVFGRYTVQFLYLYGRAVPQEILQCLCHKVKTPPRPYSA